MKIELYYNKENDCMQMVENGILKFHDEGINSTEHLSYFGNDIETVEQLKNLPIETIVEAYGDILADFKYHCGEEEVKGYFENVCKQSIQGELIFCREF